MLAQWNVANYLDDVFKFGMMFNIKINRELIIKDYLFFKKYFIPLSREEYCQKLTSYYNEYTV